MSIIIITEHESLLTQECNIIEQKSTLVQQHDSASMSSNQHVRVMTLQAFIHEYSRFSIPDDVDLVFLETKVINPDIHAANVLCFKKSVKLIVVSDACEKEFFSHVLSAGIARLMTLSDARSLLSGLTHSNGSLVSPFQIALYETDTMVQSLLQSLAKDFDCVLHIASSLDDFFDVLDSTIDVAMANIGSRYVDIPQFVKKALYVPGIQKTIFLPYAQVGAIGITDIKCGLNRLAKAVLSVSELLRFLIQLLHKRELAAINTELYNNRMTQDGVALIEEGIFSAYHRIGAEFLSPQNMLAREELDTMQHMVTALYRAYEKVRPYVWIDHMCEEKPTCGQGVYI